MGTMSTCLHACNTLFVFNSKSIYLTLVMFINIDSFIFHFETTAKNQTNVVIMTITIVLADLISLCFCCRHDSERLAKEQADAAERMKVARLK